MKTFFLFWRARALVSLVLGLGLEHSCPWPREVLSSERLSLALASDFFCVLGLGLEPCVLDSTSAKYLTKRLHQSLFLTPTTSFEVFNLVSDLKNTKSTGKDNISAYFLMVAAKVIAASLAQLFNYTFLLGIFPASLKIAKIIPI